MQILSLLAFANVALSFNLQHGGLERRDGVTNVENYPCNTASDCAHNFAPLKCPESQVYKNDTANWVREKWGKPVCITNHCYCDWPHDQGSLDGACNDLIKAVGVTGVSLTTDGGCQSPSGPAGHADLQCDLTCPCQGECNSQDVPGYKNGSTTGSAGWKCPSSKPLPCHQGEGGKPGGPGSGPPPHNGKPGKPSKNGKSGNPSGKPPKPAPAPGNPPN